VPKAQVKQLQALKLKGLDFAPAQRRVYPSAIAAPLIGVTDVEGKGVAGLELQYDKVLRGKDGLEIRTSDPAGNAISVVRNQQMQPGHTISTGIDRQVQTEAEAVARQHGAELGRRIQR
jgi:cell division protein FtsI/penicillin-binding protein 2